MIVVIAIRHANQEGDKTSDTPLTPLGEKQSHATGARLEEEVAKFSQGSVRRVIATNTKRATQTAEILAEHLKNPLITFDSRLEEPMSQEDFKRLTNDQRREMLEKSKDRTWKPIDVEGNPIGKSAAEAAEGFNAVINELRDSPPGEGPYIYVLVSHGAVTKSFLEKDAPGYTGERIPHCAFTMIKIEGGKRTYETLNDRSHLEKLGIEDGPVSSWREGNPRPPGWKK